MGTTPPVRPRTDTGEGSGEGAEDAMLGRAIGGYRITRKLGEGGMGAVYLLEHTTFTGKRQVVKVLHPQFAASQELVTRFFNEAQIVAALQHPHIIELFDFAQFESGEYFYTMEFLEGESLADHIARTRGAPRPVAEVVELLTPVADALGAVHEKGIVHRDIKPDNIFLQKKGQNPRYPKLLDFGIAKMDPASGGSQTRTGLVMGTPYYMSPEQALGRVKEIDHRTDVYALGIVAYEMIAGSVPFQAESPGDVVLAHAMTPWTPLDKVRPDLPPAVEQVVGKAIAKNKDDRWASMADFTAALKSLVDGNAVPEAVAAAISTPTPPRGTALRVATVIPAAEAGQKGAEKTGTTLTAEAAAAFAPTLESAGPAAARKSRLPIVVAGVAVVAIAAVAGIVVLGSKGHHAAPPTPPPPAAAQHAAPPAATPAVPPAAVAPATPTQVVRSTAPASAVVPAPAAPTAPAVQPPPAHPVVAEHHVHHHSPPPPTHATPTPVTHGNDTFDPDKLGGP